MFIEIVPGLAKSAPWFVHSGCVPGLYLDDKFVVTTSILKPTQTHFIAGPLGFSGATSWLMIIYKIRARQNLTAAYKI